MKKEKTKYIAYRGKVIWGIGNKPGGADRDARRWINDYNRFRPDRKEDASKLKIVPATLALTQEVELWGGDEGLFQWRIKNGVAVLVDKS